MKKISLLSAALILSFIYCFSQAGSLDLSFGNAGKVYTNIVDINRNNEAIRAMAIQPDGKILIAGSTIFPGAIIRYNPDGSLDNSFDTDGMVFCFGMGGLTAIALQSDGKIIVSGSGFSLVRLNANGTPDNSFDGDGKASTTIGSFHSQVNSLAIQSDGKIVAAGRSYNGTNENFALARFNPDGSLDNSFDVDGKLVTAFSSSGNQITGVAIQNDGKIVVAGYSYNGINATEFAIARYNTDGTLDNSFDGDGKLITSFGSSNNQANSIIIQSDGKILVAGYCNGIIYTNDFAIARYNADGSPDNSFDGDGKVVTDLNLSNDRATSMSIQSNGKIIVAGQSENDFALVRYNTDGSPDNSFDGDGKLRTDFNSSSDELTSMAIQSDGKIVAAGASSAGGSRDFSLVRYNTDGSLDNSFDSDGKLTTPIASSEDWPTAIAVQNDGKVLVGGYTGTGNNVDFALVRYNSNGSLDNSFDGDGKLTTDIESGRSQINSIAIQPDGKIVVAGACDISSYDFALVRYNIDGSLDNNFSGDGKVITPIGPSSTDQATCIAFQNDGKIVVAGYSGPGNGYHFAVVRYNTDGSLDNNFDGDGMVITTVSSIRDQISSIAIQNDGKIVVAGHSGVGFNSDFALVRYNTDGSLDNSFDGDGILTTDINSSIDVAASIVIQTDGKIVVAGRSNNGTSTDIALVRYNTNGSLDNSFDGDGKLTTAFSSGATSMALQSNGKIMVGGTGFSLARYNSNGSLDNSFDGDGMAILDMGTSAPLVDIKLYSNRIYMAGRLRSAGDLDFALAAVLNDGAPSPLPIQLLYFTGKLVNQDALLSWKTENEINTLMFIVERSTDGINYTAVGSVAAANSAGIHYYDLTDPNVTSLNTSVLYYRLKQIDINGRFTNSRVLIFPLDKNKSNVWFYPNPVIDQANLVITSSIPDHVQARIFDSKGRLMKQQQWNISAGSTLLSMDVTMFAKGVYYLELKGESTNYKRKFLK